MEFENVAGGSLLAVRLDPRLEVQELCLERILAAHNRALKDVRAEERKAIAVLLKEATEHFMITTGAAPEPEAKP